MSQSTSELQVPLSLAAKKGANQYVQTVFISCRGADVENLFVFSCVAKRLLSVSLVTTVWPTALLPAPWEGLPTDGCSERLDAGRSRSYLHGNADFVTLQENIVMIFFFWRCGEFFKFIFLKRRTVFEAARPARFISGGIFWERTELYGAGRMRRENWLSLMSRHLR